MTDAEQEKGLNRREFLLGAAAVWASSAGLLYEIQTVLAQNRREEIERLVQSGRVSEAIRTGKEDIKRTYGINIQFPNRNRVFKSKTGETIAYTTLADASQQLNALLELRRYLLKFPPKSVPALLHLHPTYIETIEVLSEITFAPPNRRNRESVGGLAFRGNDKRIALSISNNRDSEGRVRFLVDKISFTHEVVHRILNEVSSEDWIERINAKVGTAKYRDRFPQGYTYSPGYINAESLVAYDTEQPRPHGFATFYGRQNAAEDKATIAEHIFHNIVPQTEIDSEVPPLLQVKVEVLKEILAVKLGYTGRHANIAEHYWSLVGTSSFVDTMYAQETNPRIIQRNISDEFKRWEDWWDIFFRK